MRIKISIVIIYVFALLVFDQYLTFAQSVSGEPFAPIIDDNNLIYLTEREYSFITDESIKSKKRSIIYAIDVVKGTKEIFFEKSSLSELKISPNNELIAVRYTDPIAKAGGMLVIEKKTKKELLFIREENNLIYKWSPDSKKIIFITGKSEENEHKEYKIEGVWVYNIEDRKKLKIAAKAFNIEWFDNNLIYLIDTWTYHEGIMKNTRIYNYLTGKIEQQSLEGLKYSLNGKYYLRLSEESIGFWPFTEEDKKKILLDVCEFKTKKSIPREKLVNIFESPEYISWEDVIWAANNRIIVPRNTQGKMSISIYDIRNDMFLKREYGTLVGTNYKRDKLVMYTLDKKFIIVNVP